MLARDRNTVHCLLKCLLSVSSHNASYFNLLHLFIQETRANVTWRFKSNTGIISSICFSTGRAIIVIIKWETEMPTLQRSRFIFACSLGIGGHFYCNKNTNNASLNRENSQITTCKEILILSKQKFHRIVYIINKVKKPSYNIQQYVKTGK